MKKFILMLSIIATGCAGIQPTAKELAEADYGEEIKCPGDRIACPLLEGQAAGQFYDPESARVNLDLSKDYIYHKDKFVFGYKVLAMINAKNLYGGYTGSKLYAVGFIRKEKGHYFMCDSSPPRMCHNY